MSQSTKDALVRLKKHVEAFELPLKLTEDAEENLKALTEWLKK